MGSVINAYAKGNVDTTRALPSNMINSSGEAGGFIGCSSNEGVSSGIQNTYAAGGILINGRTHAGGFLGHSSEDAIFKKLTIKNSYWNTTAGQIVNNASISQANKLAIGTHSSSNTLVFNSGKVENLIGLSSAELKNPTSAPSNPSTYLGPCFLYNTIAGEFYPKLYTWDSDTNTCTKVLVGGQ